MYSRLARPMLMRTRRLPLTIINTTAAAVCLSATRWLSLSALQGGAESGGAASAALHHPHHHNNNTATHPPMLGIPVTRDEVALALRVPSEILDKSKNARHIAVTAIELARTTFAPLIATITAEKDLRLVRKGVAARLKPQLTEEQLKHPAGLPVPKGALRRFTETKWQDMNALMTFYEETMLPIRLVHDEFFDLQLSSFHVKDILKRGLSAFKQDFLDQQKEEMTRLQAAMKVCTDFMDAAVKESFNTHVCNDIVNILRIAGERHEHAHSMALRVLEDMNLMHIPYNDTTREIMNSLIFHDSPYDNSALLFEVIEYPERGEVSLSKGSLSEVSDEMLRLISARHQTPLDDGVLLRSNETHPMLQRSPE